MSNLRAFDFRLNFNLRRNSVWLLPQAPDLVVNYAHEVDFQAVYLCLDSISSLSIILFPFISQLFSLLLFMHITPLVHGFMVSAYNFITLIYSIMKPLVIFD